MTSADDGTTEDQTAESPDRTEEPTNRRETIDHITEATADRLTPRQALDFDDYLGSFKSWLAERGKKPQERIGYAESVVENTLYRIDEFYRWVWDRKDCYTQAVTHELAETYIRELKTGELTKAGGGHYSGSHIRKTRDALIALFRWRARHRGDEIWDPDIEIKEERGNRPDAFTRSERELLRTGALDYGSIPAYNDLSPEERDRWRTHLAQKLGKPKEEVSPSDWDRCNQSWKEPSLMLAALDAALRPVEVERSTMDWLRLDKGVIHIPKDLAAKSRDHWEPALTSRTQSALERWLQERATRPKYDGRDEIWLTRHGNPYESSSLNYLLNRILEEVDIDTQNRRLCWYSIRHSTGMYVASDGDISEAREQLRHKNPETTMQYARPPPEERRGTLEGIE